MARRAACHVQKISLISDLPQWAGWCRPYLKPLCANLREEVSKSGTKCDDRN